MTDRARAAVLTEFGQPLEIREFPILAPEPGGLVVAVEAATVCGTDVHNWQGHASSLKPPVVPGHEGVGRIIAFGDHAEADSRGTPLALGDRVVWGHANCGKCHACTMLQDETLCADRFIGMLTPCTRPPYLHGTFADHALIHPRAGRIRVPDAVGSELASAASCALRSVIAAFNRLGALDYRDAVLIQGAGPLGLFATAVASMHAPRRLIVIGAPDARLELAKEFGADATISIEAHPDPAERTAIVRELTNGRGADVLFEFAGSTHAFGEGVEMAAPKARYVMAGAVGGTPQPVSAPLLIKRNLTVIGSLGAAIGAYADALEFIERFDGRFAWDRLLGPGRYSLEDATLALQRTNDLEETKAVILPGRVGLALPEPITDWRPVCPRSAARALRSARPGCPPVPCALPALHAPPAPLGSSGTARIRVGARPQAASMSHRCRPGSIDGTSMSFGLRLPGGHCDSRGA